MREKERDKIATRAAFFGILANLFLFVVKYLLSLYLHSLSIAADAWNNLSDVGNSLIGLVAGKLSGKKADREHPFGHGRIEYLAAFLVSAFMIQLGFQTIRSALLSFGKKEELVLFGYWFFRSSLRSFCFSIFVLSGKRFPPPSLKQRQWMPSWMR